MDALERCFARRLAIRTADADDERDREAICQFRDSLPPPISRLLLVGLFIGALVLAQEALDVLPRLAIGVGTQATAKALEGLGPSPSVASTRGLLDAILNSSAIELLIFVAAISWSAYLVTRPLACGYRLATLALGRPDGLGLPRRRAELVITARHLATSEKEKEIFTKLRTVPPPELPFDIIVKAALCMPLLLYGALVLKSIRPPDYPDLLLGGGIFALVVARLFTLGLASRKRGAGTRWLFLPLPFLVLICVVPPLLPPDRGRVLSQPQLRLTLSARRDLSGVDLRDRNLKEFYFYGKDLSHAELSGANLTKANLTRARLPRAELDHATLSDAILRGAQLRQAHLSNAGLSNADLRGADLRQANLSHADLSYTDLRGADLRQANLSHADLYYTDLRGADLRQANLSRTNFTGVELARADVRGTDLRRTLNLDQIYQTYDLGVRTYLALTRYDRATLWPPHLEPHPSPTKHP